MNLIFEFLAVDGTAAATCARGIAGLQHKVWDYAVKDDVVVVASLGQLSEVLAGLWVGIVV